MNKILVSGSRFWRNDEYGRLFIKNFLESIGPIRTLVHGGQQGVDVIAGDIGKELGANVISCRIDFTKDGFWPRAGTNRNLRMWQENHLLSTEPIELVVCFPLSLSTGTYHMKRVAELAGVPTVVVKPEQWYDDLCLEGRKPREVKP